MKKLFTFFSLLMLLLVTAPALRAQDLPADSVRAQMIGDWERAKVYTNAYLAVMPADKYDAKPNDSIRTFAQQMLHLATANIGLMANATGNAMLYPPGRLFSLEKTKSAQSVDSVHYYVNESYDYAINSIKKMDMAKLWEPVTLFGFSASRYAFLLKVFEHQTHHRGQCTIYIRTQGIKPPQEMLF